MCTNSARLVDSVECYMDDLVECFEDFVKKSLCLISVAVGAVIVMLGYVLKVVTERTQPPALSFSGSRTGVPRTAGTAVNSAEGSDPIASEKVHGANANLNASEVQRERKRRVGSSAQSRSSHSVTTASLKNDSRGSTAANAGSVSCVPGFDEKMLRNIGLSSGSKNCMQSKRPILHNGTASRTLVPSTPASIPNQHLSTPRQSSRLVANRKSCCSMCCDEHDRR